MFNSKHAMNRHEFNSAMGYENDMVPCPCQNNNPDCPYCYGTGIFQMQPIEEENDAANKMVQHFNNMWEKHPVAKESDLPAHYKGSKYATSDEIAKQHHELASNLIDTRIIPTLHGVATAGTIQEVMNLIAADHEKQFPDCQHCNKLREVAFEPAETSDIIEDIRKVFNEEHSTPAEPKDMYMRPTPRDMSMRPTNERGEYIPMDELPDDVRIKIDQEQKQQQRYDL